MIDTMKSFIYRLLFVVGLFVFYGIINVIEIFDKIKDKENILKKENDSYANSERTNKRD